MRLSAQLTFFTTCIALSAALAGVPCVAAAQMSERVRIAEDGTLVVAGERTFILGLYEDAKDDAVVAAVSEAGYNLLPCGNSIEALDRLHAAGIHSWVGTGGAIDLSSDTAGRKEQLRSLVDAFGSHPAVLLWEVPDEMLWGCWAGSFHYRYLHEPAALREEFAKLEDRELADALDNQLRESQKLFHRGDYEEGEGLADDLWRKLGQDPKSGPSFNYPMASQQARTLRGGLVEGYAFLKQLDPGRPIWMNHAPRGPIPQLAEFNEAADIVSCDIYPLPAHVGHSDLADRTLAATGAYTRRMRKSAPGKPVWMVLQGFGWADIDNSRLDADGNELNRRPRHHELRFMAYDAIVHGARGVLFWGTTAVEKDSELWGDVLDLGRELSGLQPVLSAPDADLAVEIAHGETLCSLDQGVCVLPKSVNGATWFIVVSEAERIPLQYTIHGLASLEGQRYSDPAAERTATVTDGSLTSSIRGRGVHLLRPEPASP